MNRKCAERDESRGKRRGISILKLDILFYYGLNEYAFITFFGFAPSLMWLVRGGCDIIFHSTYLKCMCVYVYVY